MARHGARSALAAGHLAAVVVVGVTAVPLLYVVVGGVRTTGRINSWPAGLPDPWARDDYRAVLGSAAFWRFPGNSALIAVIATAPAVALGSMAAFAFRAARSSAVRPSARCSRPRPTALPLYQWSRTPGMPENPPHAGWPVTPSASVGQAVQEGAHRQVGGAMAGQCAGADGCGGGEDERVEAVDCP